MHYKVGPDIPVNISNIVIYSTLPDQKIIGFCRVKDCVVASPEKLWENYKTLGAINETAFFNYYQGYSEGKCYILKNPCLFVRPIPLSKGTTISTPPQSFVYLTGDQWMKIRRKKTVRFQGPMEGN